MGVVLKAENVAIRYITGDFKDIGLKEYTMRRLTGNYQVKEFRAVDGVSFELHEGDMLGIIGSNGAGKSTLLKAVAGIMEPTQGKITANGDVAALLELGSGFDGDLTVKENAYLRGAMLGYTKEFMDETYEQIIDFAELKEFENRPFKQLSSGMKSRLAFSIASLVKPDILILDEVLSVGDGAFQEKSAKKMREIISQGATTILVSHSLEQIRELCNKVLWLDHGRQVAFGDSAEICDRYEAFLRGECPAEMPGAEENENSEAVAVITDDISTNGEPDKKIKLFSGKRVIVSFVLALFCAVLAFNLGELYFTKAQGSQVQISAQAGSGEVTFRGAAVDGIWVSPSDHVIDDGGWYYDDEQVVYTAINGSALVFNLPAGDERTLTFNAGPDCGVALVDIDGEHFEFNLWNENVIELGLPYEVPAFSMQSILKYIYTLSTIIFALAFVIGFILYKGDKPLANIEREVWLDVLRGFCCFVIVLLHCTCNVYKEFGENWYIHMLMSCFTAFAVPCFYMVSGASLLRREHSVKEIWLKRVPKIAVPLLFWSVIYIFLGGDLQLKRFVAMFFQGQWPHLWFMYCIFGIYALLPMLSRLYAILDTKLKLYMLILLLFVPTILHDGQYLFNSYFDMPKFAVFWPDLGLFFWGMFLWEQRDKLTRWGRLLPLGFFLGLCITVACTVYTSFRDGVPNTNFISCIGSIGVLLMAGSLFAFCAVYKERLQSLNLGLKKCIASLGAISFGIYLIHPLIMDMFGYLYSNTGNILQMLFGAVMYFSICVLVCLCAQYVRGMSKLV